METETQKTTIIRKPRKVSASTTKRKSKVITLAPADPVVTVAPMTTIETPLLKVKDEYPRSVLGEGRSYGISFAFAKLHNATFECVGPLSPCKDYLNDQVFSEATGKPYSAYGYKAKTEGLFKDGFAHVVMRVLGYKSGPYGDQPRDTENLAKNYKAIAAFMNYFEELLKLPTKTIIVEVPSLSGETVYHVASIPPFWASRTYLISLWTLMVRVAVESGWDDKSNDPMKRMKECKTGDAGYAAIGMARFDKMVAGEIPDQDWEAGTFWHNEGIVTFKGFKS